MVVEPITLDAWIARQAQCSIAAMERAISATHLVRRRESFAQVIVPAPGSVIAAPAFADWDPAPDYFFHWLRDSAVVMRCVADLMHDAETETERERWHRHFTDFIHFSLALNELDGTAFLSRSNHRRASKRGVRRFLRSDAELRALAGDRLFGEPRFNPDGSIDITRWSRPQYDGPALRALACLRFLAAGGAQSDEIAALLRQDLAFTLRHAGRRCVGPWEESEQIARHYYVELVQLGALVHGRAWVEDGTAWGAAEKRVRAGLEQHWSEQHQTYVTRLPAVGEGADDLVDAAQLIAVLVADLRDGRHSVVDTRFDKTQSAIENLFALYFPINRGRPAPALGRYRSDRYFGGGAWYATTLAAAELAYRRALLPGQDNDAWLRRGDAFMATVRDLTPPDGALSEQVDPMSGVQRSACHLSWSYAAFVGAARSRIQAISSAKQKNTTF